MSDLERYLAPPVADKGGDPLIDELKARQRTQAAMGIVRDGNPDQAGRANELGRIFNVPPDTIERNLPAFEAADRERQATQMMALYPAIGKWAANPRHAAVAKDDIHHLARMSAAFQQWDQQKAAEQVLQVQRGQEWAKTHGTLTAPPPRAPTVWNFARGIAGDFVQAGIQMRAGFRTMLSDLVGDSLTPKAAPGAPQVADFGRQHAILEYERAQAQMGENQPAFKTDLGRGFYAGVSSLAQMLPATIASVATGNPAPVLTYAGASQATQAYAKYRSRGASPTAAGLGAAGEGAVEVATEYLPMKYFVSRLGTAGFGEFVGGLLGREIPSEQVATHVQDAIDAAIANPDMTLKQYLAQRPGAAAQTLIATVTQSLLLGGPAHVVTHLGRHAEAADAQEGADFLDQMAKAAQESKVRERDPEAFRRFIEEHASGTGAENLYIPGEKLRELMQSAPLDDGGFFGSYADQIAEASTTHGDVVVPLSEALTHLAGTPAWDAIKNDVRLSAGGMSLNEAKSFDEAKADEMKAMSETMSAQMESDRAAMEPRQKIAEAVRDKLMKVGYRPDVANAYAEVVAARYATRAERLGHSLTGNEADALELRQVLPEKLARVQAADQLDLVIEAMKKAKAARGDSAKFGPSLLEFIARRGGVEDKAGDIASMGGAEWHKGRPGRRKLIRQRPEGADLLGDRAGNDNTPDALAHAAWEAGYFPNHAERPSVDEFLQHVGDELRGRPIYAEDRSSATDDIREAAQDLYTLLDQQGLDPEKASRKEIRAAIERYQQEQTEGRSLDQAVFHGSPHIFDKFSLEHVGAGEGAQAFGWGLYFTNEKAIAEFYRDKLSAQWRSGDDMKWGGKTALEHYEAADRRGEYGKLMVLERIMLHNPKSEIVASLKEGIADGDSQAVDGMAYLKTLPDEAFAPTAGRLYEVDIPEDNEYLLWDRPITAQPEAVKAALKKSGLWKDLKANLSDFSSPQSTRGKLKGENIYSYLAWKLGSEESASRRLNELGIPGLKYPAGSIAQTRKKNNYNYVLFDDSRVAIRSHEQSFNEGVRGRITFTSDGKSIIDLFESRDLSTFIHESGHLFLDELWSDAAAAEAPDQLKGDRAVLVDWFKANGIKMPKDGTLPTEAHELFARGFERFAMEGKAPSSALRRAFEAFRSWLLTIYKVVENLRSPISDDVRAVMQRLVATDEEIAAAAEEQNIKALFNSAEEAGMTEPEFAAYQRATAESRDEAYDALLYRTMSAIRAQRTKAWKEEEAGVRAKVTAGVDAQPIFRALKLLTAGTDDGAKPKLDRAWLTETYRRRHHQPVAAPGAADPQRQARRCMPTQSPRWRALPAATR
jgi:hypothetical protein